MRGAPDKLALRAAAVCLVLLLGTGALGSPSALYLAAAGVGTIGLIDFDVVDASNLERNLYYATQVIELGYPTIVALNMVDVAERQGHHIDPEGLSDQLGVPVVPVVANVGQGVTVLREAILKNARNAPKPEKRLFCELPAEALRELDIPLEQATAGIGPEPGR